MNTSAIAPGTSTCPVQADGHASVKDLLAMALGPEPSFTCILAASQAPAAAMVDRLRAGPALMDVRADAERRRQRELPPSPQVKEDRFKDHDQAGHQGNAARLRTRLPTAPNSGPDTTPKRAQRAMIAEKGETVSVKPPG
jgi:hypothetical protein